MEKDESGTALYPTGSPAFKSAAGVFTSSLAGQWFEACFRQTRRTLATKLLKVSTQILIAMFQ